MQTDSPQQKFRLQIEIFRNYFLAIIVITGIFTTLGLINALLAPNIYKTTAILAPSQSKFSSNFSGVQSSFGGIAALAGLESSGSITPTSIAIMTLSSVDFFKTLYADEDFLKNMIAISAIDADGLNPQYDSRYIKNNKWVLKPSMASASRIFYQKHFSVFKDRKSGFVYLHVEHTNPVLAYLMQKTVLNNINEYMQSKHTLQSQKALDYIEQKIALTNNRDVKNVLAKLAERELQILILSKADSGFAFETIQSPSIPTEKDRPRKSIMVLNAFILGLIASFLWVLSNQYINLQSLIAQRLEGTFLEKIFKL